MAETKTLARPYAEAAFELAKERDGLMTWSDMLQLISDIVADERVAVLIVDPRVSKAHLTGLLLDVGGSSLNQDAKNFVRLLVENERLGLLPDIRSQFEELKADAEGIVEVEAISAFELNQAQKKKISQAVEKKLGREVKLTARVDKSLIGGVVIRAGDFVIDGSVTGRLRDLALQLSQ
ncbi:MAG: F0F1 ATP synthase subunit delta [Acidiferrobacterales bacterium]